MAFSSDERTIASGAEDGEIRLWDAVSGDALDVLPADAGRVNSIAFSSGSSEGSSLASVSDRVIIRLWRSRCGD